jgi:DNA invertase Pin-like site-specific DNA recombinase
MFSSEHSSMRAGLYARVSREEQAEGYSLDEQIAAMRRYCEQRGWQVAAEYVEPGVSGTTGDRPALRRVLADCGARKLDVLLTHQLDRLARNLRLQLEILSDLGRWHVAYISVVEQIDYTTPQGSLFLSMLGAFNEYYVANLRRETKKGKRGRATAGRSNASYAPLGYRRQDGQDVIDPDTATGVRLAFEAYATGENSDVDVARLLNESGIPPVGRALSGRWTREGVRYLLCNPFYVGMVRYGGETYPGQHEPLITRELWDRVQAKRAERRSPVRRGRGPDRVYLLAKLLRCSDCGLPLIAHTVGGRARGETVKIPVYMCPSQRRSVECGSQSRYVRASVVEGQVAELIGRLRLPPDWRSRLEAMAGESPEKDEQERKRRKLEGRLHHLREIYLDGDMKRDEYARRKLEIEVQLAGLNSADVPAVHAAGETLENLAAAWARATAEIRGEMLRTLFESIVVDITRARVISVRPRPTFVVLFRMDGMDEEQEGSFRYEPAACPRD